MQIRCVLEQLMLVAVIGPSLAMAQPDIDQDIEACAKAQTPAQCQAALPACEQVLTGLAQGFTSPTTDRFHGAVLKHTAWCEHQLGRYALAERHFRNALALSQRLHGLEHLDVAACLNNLGLELQNQGKYEEAEILHRQALQMMQKLLGAEHRDVAASLSNLGLALTEQGKYEAAETLFRQALQMMQRLHSSEHPDVAACIANLSMVLSKQGKYEAAETLSRQGLAMQRRLLGAEHPDVATSVDNLALTLHYQGKYEAAETLFRQGLAMQQKMRGAKHPIVAASINNLAGVLSSQGKYEAAETLYRQVLAMNQELLGAEHPDLARNINNLALVLDEQGKYEAAETLFRQGLAMRQRLLGVEHPDLAISLRRLALVLMKRGQFPDALPLFTQAAQVEESQFRATSSESRMLTALNQVRGTEDVLYGLQKEQPKDERLQRLVMTTALLRKGRAAEAGTIANRLLHLSGSNQGTKELFERWQQVRQQREALLYGSGGNLAPTAYRERLKELSQQADDMESQLAAAMPELRQLQPPKFNEVLPAVAARLPKDGVLLEVVWTSPYNFTAKGMESRWGTPHYVGMVLSADQKISVHDLGEASIVDSQVQSLLAALRNPASDPKESARTVYNQILKPLLPPTAKHLYLSLDGALSLVPFDALHDGTDYLLGRRSFHYLTSGRDLLRTDSEPAKHAALVLADPDFGKADNTTKEESAETFYQKLSALHRLPGAQREAEQIGRLLSLSPIVGSAAKESVLRAAQAPWVVHIASHGLFLKTHEVTRPAARGLGLFGERKLVPLGESSPEHLQMSGQADSLSRSALVLAGAAQGDQAKSAAEDGLLTADEARSLDLFGTQLVVLSACDSGQGELSVGQGVYGLRRAFMVAGAETLVTSLWQVNDATTGKLMELYYQKLLKKKKGRLEGMQEAMKEMRTKYPHPYYWAPFLVIGSDGPLRPLVARPKGQ